MAGDLTELFDYAGAPKETLTACNLCGSTDLMASIRYDRYGYRINLSHCKGCGLVFINPRMTAAAYAAFYQGPYRALVSAFHCRVINSETVEADQAPYAEALAQLLAPHIPASSFGKLIDVGGSTGVVAAALCKRFHYFGTVVDVADEELERAKAKGLRVIKGTAEDFTRMDLFDLAVLCQTIDHLLDPMRVLIKLRNALAEAGFLFVDILNYESKRELKIDHPFYFTKLTMQAMLWKARFAVCQPVLMANHHVGFIALPVRTS